MTTVEAIIDFIPASSFTDIMNTLGAAARDVGPAMRTKVACGNIITISLRRSEEVFARRTSCCALSYAPPLRF
jgi:hypothetical protein